ncbi:hypothetical protein [Microbacterium sp. 5K110]|jgi:hypothetical protein|uniref:hypothetical protein n=1 Tax=Microbacterium sp. 5K110 TaxID=2578104 RepID=UPI0010FE7F86|nr:hypothetical protein [Microbacterium sp. 5K110]TLF33230.1 hypothetical protein FE256_03805 [Microbacterium sp. 5K110]
MNFDELLTRSEQRPRAFKDVHVCLDGDIAERISSLRAQITDFAAEAATDQRLASGENPKVTELKMQIDDLRERAMESLVTLRFYRIPGHAWSELSLHHPVRADVPVDRHYGYNISTLSLAAAAYVDQDTDTAYGYRVEDDEEHRLTLEQWARLFAVLSGSEVTDVQNAVWSLNEAEPASRLDALVKDFGAARRSATK